MHIRMLSICLSVFVGVCFFPVRSAESMDSAFSYQGNLSVSDRPAEGNFDFRFILYGSEIGGSQVGPILYGDDIEVSGGLFSLYLNFGDEVFDGSQRWLEVAVRSGDETGAYTPLGPRQAIMPSPYSLRAGRISWSDIEDIPAGYADDADADPSNELQTLSLEGTSLSLSREGGTVVLPVGVVNGYTDLPEAVYGPLTLWEIARVDFTLDEESTVLILADVNVWGEGACEDAIELEINGELEPRTSVHVDNQAPVPSPVNNTNNGVSVHTSWMQTLPAGQNFVRLKTWGGCNIYVNPHLHVLVLSN